MCNKQKKGFLFKKYDIHVFLFRIRFRTDPDLQHCHCINVTSVFYVYLCANYMKSIVFICTPCVNRSLARARLSIKYEITQGRFLMQKSIILFKQQHL